MLSTFVVHGMMVKLQPCLQLEPCEQGCVRWKASCRRRVKIVCCCGGHQIGEKELSAPRSANSPRNGGHCGRQTLQSSCRKPRPRTCSTHPTIEITLVQSAKRPHDLQIPSYKTNILDKNVITRTILALNYTWTELCRLTLTSTIVNLLLYCFFFVLSVRLSRHK